MKDEKLLKTILRDPESGMERLVAEYGGLVCAVIRSRLSGTRFCEADIEDCAAETFADLYAGLKAAEHSGDLSGFPLKGRLCVIAKRRAADMLRRFYREADVVPLTPEISAAVPAPGSVEDAFAEAETRAALIAAVKALGRPDSEIIIRKFFLGQSAKEIAEATSLSESNVNTRTHRALKKLKNSMGGEYYER